MNTLKYNEKDKLHFLWFMIVAVCIAITYCYQKSKATGNYKTILQVASKNCNLAVVEFSVKNLLDINTQIPRLTALHCAAEGECLEVVEFLVNAGANIDASGGYEGWTVLHSAALGGHLKIVRLLLENGANPNVIDDDGKTPRRVAVIESRHNKQKPYREIIKLLADAEDQYKSEK